MKHYNTLYKTNFIYRLFYESAISLFWHLLRNTRHMISTEAKICLCFVHNLLLYSKLRDALLWLEVKTIGTCFVVLYEGFSSFYQPNSKAKVASGKKGFY